MDQALTVSRINQAVATNRRMYHRYLAGWASDYLRFNADEGRRCTWGGQRHRQPHNAMVALAKLIAPTTSDAD